LQDVNLSQIAFPRGTSEVVLSFLNMVDGAPVGSLVCRGLLAFVYHNLPDEALPQYIGEVTLGRIDSAEAWRLLEQAGYQLEPAAEPRGLLYKVSIEGGITIDIVCHEAELLP